MVHPRVSHLVGPRAGQWVRSRTDRRRPLHRLVGGASLRLRNSLRDDVTDPAVRHTGSNDMRFGVGFDPDPGEDPTPGLISVRADRLRLIAAGPRGPAGPAERSPAQPAVATADLLVCPPVAASAARDPPVPDAPQHRSIGRPGGRARPLAILAADARPRGVRPVDLPGRTYASRPPLRQSPRVPTGCRPGTQRHPVAELRCTEDEGLREASAPRVRATPGATPRDRPPTPGCDVPRDSRAPHLVPTASPASGSRPHRVGVQRRP